MGGYIQAGGNTHRPARLILGDIGSLRAVFHSLIALNNSISTFTVLYNPKIYYVNTLLP